MGTRTSTELPIGRSEWLRMATLERISHTPHRCAVVDGKVDWTPVDYGARVDGLPQIIWSDGTPWRAANIWALERATTKEVSLKTVYSNLSALQRYASWLEESQTDWRHFPVRKADRCLVRFRGKLIKDRDAGKLAPSTASQTMTAVVQYYRWLHASGLISPDWPMWRDRIFGVQLVDAVGFIRTIHVNSTDLAIRNRRAPGLRLEDGLLPVSAAHRTQILEFAEQSATEEVFLMLSLGFYTGMRIGTISDLRIQTLERAVPDPASANLFRLAVGPGADPPVNTKGSVTGQIRITRAHLDALKQYCYSTRRLHRQSKAAPEHRSLVFMSKNGKPYTTRGSDYSSSLNVAMHELRKSASKQGLEILRNFRFHQTRATFATELARMAIGVGGAINALAIVKEFLLHKSEATSLLYIRFAEQTAAKGEAANAFTREFMGALSGRMQTDEN